MHRSSAILILPLALLLFGVVAGAISGGLSHRYRQARSEHEFETRAAGIVSGISNDIQAHLEVIHSVKAFFESSEFVSRREFRQFAIPMLEGNDEIQALQWAPVVGAEERWPLEQAAQAERPGYVIREQAPDRTLVAAPPRAEYIPIYYIQPYEGNQPALGFDLGSDPRRRAALERARDTGMPCATGGIRLVQRAGDGSGFLISYPVYRPHAAFSTVDERRAALQGFAIGVFHLPTLIGEALQGYRREGIDIRVFDRPASEAEALLLVFPGTAAAPLPPAAGADRSAMTEAPGAVYSHVLNVADREWRVTCAAAPDLAPLPWVPVAAGAVTFALFALLALYAAAIGTRREHAEREVKIRTRELNEQKTMLDSVLASAAEGVVVSDVNGRFLHFNPAAEAIIGLGGTAGGAEKWSATYGLFLPDQRTAFPPDKLPLALAIRGEHSDNVEIFVRNERLPAGKFIAVTGRPLRRPDGSLAGGVATFRDVTELRRLEEQLRAEAVRDPLTTLYNRRHFDEQLTLQLRLVRRHDAPFCLCMCDLDKFKQVNDGFGHPAGDQVLRSFAHLLREELRVEDLAFRMGGDEFAVLFPGVTGGIAGRCMERIRARWEAARFRADNGVEFSLGCSIGIAQWRETVAAPEAMTALADQALYQAKQQGRNRVVVDAP